MSDPLAILRDQGGIELPIHRTDMDDPDNENTIASAVFHVGNTAVKWEIYDQNSERPIYRRMPGSVKEGMTRPQSFPYLHEIASTLMMVPF